MDYSKLLSSNLSFNLGNFSFSPSYLEAGAIVLLLFVLVLTMAQLRRHLVDWSLKGAVVGIFFGFLLALILEGFLVIGGKTALTEVLGWKNPPKPLQVAIDAGREKLVNVLGIKDEIPKSFAGETLDAGRIISSFQSLNPSEVQKVKNLICK